MRPFTVPKPVTTPSPGDVGFLHAEIGRAVLDEHVDNAPSNEPRSMRRLDALARGQLAALVLRLDAEELAAAAARPRAGAALPLEACRLTVRLLHHAPLRAPGRPACCLVERRPKAAPAPTPLSRGAGPATSSIAATMPAWPVQPSTDVRSRNLADFGGRRRRIAAEIVGKRHQNAGRAVAALERVVVAKGVL